MDNYCNIEQAGIVRKLLSIKGKGKQKKRKDFRIHIENTKGLII